MRRILSFFEETINRFLLSDRRGGLFRLVFLFFILFLFTLLSHHAFEKYPIDAIVRRWTDHYGLLKLLPDTILNFLVLVIWDFRYFWISFMAFIGMVLIAARYIQDIYDLPRLRLAVRYLLSSTFSMFFPSLVIRDGNLLPDPDDPNLIRDVGGPGLLIVEPGNVVLSEHLDRSSRVVPEGVHFLTRFETIRRLHTDDTEIPLLNERHGYIEESRATTKDGIVVVVRDVNFRYRLRSGKEFGDYVQKDSENPNPYSVQAVYDMVYNRSVRLNLDDRITPEMNPWNTTINFAVDGAIAGYIQERMFNDIVAPQFPNEPRQAITDRIFSQGVRQRLRTNGAELLWWDIGHFAVEDNRVSRQLIETWGTKWTGGATVRSAFGEAKRLEYLERGRTEAQAEMLTEILKSLEGMNLGEAKEDNIRNIILARVAQLIEGMADQGRSTSSPELPPPSY